MSDASPAQFPKRFYENATAAGEGDRWTIELDGRALKTPAGATLAVPNQALANALADEWARQEDRIHIARMHLTRLANVAIDRTPDVREGMARQLVRYCGTDLVCHLAAGPPDLRDLQDAGWAPVRAWAARTLQVALTPVEGIIALEQPIASLEAARAHALGLDDFRLTGLSYACGLYGSALLALAVEQAEMCGLEAFERTLIDERYQMNRWGADAEAEARIEGHRREAQAVKDWFESLDIR